MKKYILLMALLITASNFCLAQNNSDDSIAYRLVTAVSIDSGTVDKHTDSTAYSYTGSHGGTEQEHLNFSTSNNYYYSKKLKRICVYETARQTFNSDDQVDTMLTVRFSYDDDKKCIYKRQQTSQYNSNTYKTVDLYVDWDSTSRGWDTSTKFDYAYDSTGNLISENCFVWDAWKRDPPFGYPDSNSWSPFRSTDYNSNNILVSSITTRESPAYEPTYNFACLKSIYLFDKSMNDSVELKVGYNNPELNTDTLWLVVTILGQNNKKDSIILKQDWDTTLRQWVNQQRDCYTYGDDNSVFISDQYRQDDHWRMNKDTYTKNNSINLPAEKMLREYDYYGKIEWQDKTFFTYEPYHLKGKNSK